MRNCLLRLFFALLLAACSSEIKAPARTQVMLRIQLGEPELHERVTHLRVSTLRKDEAWVAASSVTVGKDMIRHWPLDIPITPSSSAAASKPFEVIVDALAGEQRLAQARVIASYALNTRRVLEVQVYACTAAVGAACAPDDCHGESCLSCGMTRSCEPVRVVDPSELPELGSMPSPVQAGEGGVEAGVVDAPDADLDAAVLAPPVDIVVAACSQEGALRCLGEGTRMREQCTQGVWQPAPECGPEQVCDSQGASPGECTTPLDLCRGSAGGAVCADAILHVCGQDGTSVEEMACTSARHCELGRAEKRCAACLPGEHRCTQRKLERCDDKQTWQLVQECPESGEICNAAAGACTSSLCKANHFNCGTDAKLQRCAASEMAYEDVETCQAGLCDALGGQCDKCTPQARDCSGSMARVCNADGQGYAATACEAPRAICAGAGNCVACTADSHCTAPECSRASCNVASGDCASVPATRGTACNGGLCDGAGSCGYCGDRMVQMARGEQCDDGNTVATDSCNDCKSARCGDGITQTGEQCDDANTVNTDNCANCRNAACGDGFVQPGEQCDDGNQVDSDACADCRSARCGDGITQTGEQCDDGNSVTTDACANCQNARCGDGIRRAGSEECDDGNSVNTDGCTNGCTNARCGDGFKQSGEDCDDGNSSDTDTCTNACKNPRCGDGFKLTSEECDDGNTSNTDSCTNTCKEARCGDGFGQSGEGCDDGNTSNTDACTNSCTAARCGDGFIRANSSEECELNSGSWNFTNCEGASCKRIFYNACSLSSQCPSGQYCALGDFCTNTCVTAQGCPTVPGYNATCFGQDIGDGRCGLECSSSGGCPAGLTCVTHVQGDFGPPGPTRVCIATRNPLCCNNNDCYGCFWQKVGS
jgi:cysteine-rich repeat protein